MLRKIFFVLIYFVFFISYAYPTPPASLTSRPYMSYGMKPIKNNDRILILAPHPDDETLGCAGLIQQALKAGAEIKVIYLTNGDHNQFAFMVYKKRIIFTKGGFIHMGKIRRQEAIRAMQLLGVDRKNLIFLGYPDLGTFSIFNSYWKESVPYRSIFTRVTTVPYREDASFGKPHKGESILGDLKKAILDYKPTKVFVSHPADSNGEHKALYLFLEVALADLSRAIPKPEIYPYLVHCAMWPSPRHYRPLISLDPPKSFLDSSIRWIKLPLSSRQVENKHQATLCYKSQTRSSAFYLLAFNRKNELFGSYPKIELKNQVSSIVKSPKFLVFPRNLRFDSNGLNNLSMANQNKIRVGYAILDNNLLIRVEKTKKFKIRLGILVHIFGYNYKTPFASMPKMTIIARGNMLKVFNGRKMVKIKGVNMESYTDSLTLRVPLETLREPDFILLSVRGLGRILPVDVTGFRKIEIKK